MFNVLKDFINRVIIRKPTPGVPHPPIVRAINTTDPIVYFINDPTTPDLKINVPVPASIKLPVKITGYMGGGQQWGTLAAQAAGCYVTLAKSLDYIIPQITQPVSHWAAVPCLTVLPRAGKDFNAYYDRTGLKFFFDVDPVLKSIIFACEAPDVVSHELGHALLDIMRPEFWNTQAMEVWAFHESFGDCNAMLTMLLHDEVLTKVLNQTNGDMSKSNIVSCLAEQLGLAIYNVTGGQAGDPTFLRNAVNDFKYVQPETLSSDAPDNQLSSEPHNFSRIWTGTWYDILVKIYNKLVEGGMEDKAALIQARDTAGSYLLKAIQQTPATVRLFTAMANSMLVIDQAAGSPYQVEMKSVFENRQIISHVVPLTRELHWKDFKVNGHDTVINHAAGTTVRRIKNHTIKLSDHLGDDHDNPLYDLTIEVPGDEHYEFNNVGKMVGFTGFSKSEAIDAAHACLNYLHDHNLVTPDEKTPFEAFHGKLIRTHFVCDCSFLDNGTNPQSPEFGKRWKPENNAGCACHKKEQEERHHKPHKQGCVINCKTGGSINSCSSSSVSYRGC